MPGASSGLLWVQLCLMHQGTFQAPGPGTMSDGETKEQEETQRDEMNRRAQRQSGAAGGGQKGRNPGPSPCSQPGLAGALDSLVPGRGGTEASSERTHQGRFPRATLSPAQKICHSPKTSDSLPSAEPTLRFKAQLCLPKPPWTSKPTA